MTKFKKYLLISLIFATLNAVLLLILFVPRFDHTDTREYITTIDYVLKKSGGELHLNRLLYPLPILISALLNPIFTPENALIFQNIVFYFLSAFLIFILVNRLYQNEKQAFYGVALYVTAYPMLAYGISALTDLSGWFFYLFSVFLSLNFLKNPKIKTALIPGFIAGFGMLFKENVAAASVFFFALLFFATKFSIKDKIKYILIFGLAFLLPVLINSIIFYKFYSYSYLERYIGVVHDKTGGIYAYSFLRILIEIGRAFAVGWIFFLIGSLKEFYSKNKERLKILFAFIFPSFSFFLWSFPHNRIIFIAVPLLVFLGSLGLLRNFKSKRLNMAVEISLLFIYLLANYLLLEFLLRYGALFQRTF